MFLSWLLNFGQTIVLNHAYNPETVESKTVTAGQRNIFLSGGGGEQTSDLKCLCVCVWRRGGGGGIEEILLFLRLLQGFVGLLLPKLFF